MDAVSLRADWPAQLETWRDLLAECNSKPARKRVHLLRVATLRLQAQIGDWLDRHEPNHPAAPIFKRWNKLARNLRRALGTVRSFDVYLATLAKVRSTLTTSTGYKPRSCRASLRQIEELQRRFKRNRKAAAKNLIEVLTSRMNRLQLAATEMAFAPALQLPLVPAIPSGRLAEMLAAVVSAFPRLDAESLHDFRKQLKSVRYLGELNANSHEARDLVATVKAMQGSIGEWHDWEELAAEARRAFHEEVDLAVLLETMARESLDRALAFCGNITNEIPPDRAHGTPTLPAKKIVRRAESSAARSISA